MFGYAEDGVKPFANAQHSLCVGLFYDSINGAQRKRKFLQNVKEEYKRLQDLRHGESTGTQEESEESSAKRRKYAKYFKLVNDELQIDYDNLQQDWYKKGF